MVTDFAVMLLLHGSEAPGFMAKFLFSCTSLGLRPNGPMFPLRKKLSLVVSSRSVISLVPFHGKCLSSYPIPSFPHLLSNITILIPFLNGSLPVPFPSSGHALSRLYRRGEILVLMGCSPGVLLVFCGGRKTEIPPEIDLSLFQPASLAT